MKPTKPNFGRTKSSTTAPTATSPVKTTAPTLSSIKSTGGPSKPVLKPNGMLSDNSGCSDRFRVASISKSIGSGGSSAATTNGNVSSLPTGRKLSDGSTSGSSSSKGRSRESLGSSGSLTAATDGGRPTQEPLPKRQDSSVDTMLSALQRDILPPEPKRSSSIKSAPARKPAPTSSKLPAASTSSRIYAPAPLVKKSSSIPAAPMPVSSKPVIPSPATDGDAYDDDEFEEYEEDFEEYHSDTEETKPEPVKAPVAAPPKPVIPQSTHARSPVNVSQKSTSSAAHDTLSTSSTAHTIPASAPILPKQKRFSTMDKHRRRFKDLSAFLELEPSPVFSIFDLPPLTQYEMYIRQYGKSNTVQVSTQFKEEDELCFQEQQTDTVESTSKWIQTYHGNGREGSGVERYHGCVTVWRLMCKVVERLLEANLTGEMGSGMFDDIAEEGGLSKSKSRLRTDIELLKGRYVRDVCFASTDHQLLLIAWSLPKENIGKFSRNGLLTLWQLTDASKPWRILVCDGEPTCACISPFDSNFIFAGTSDGNVIVWNLTDTGCAGKDVVVFENQTAPLQYCSFMSHSFNALYQGKDLYGNLKGHTSTVRRIQVLGEHQGSALGSGKNEGELIQGSTSHSLIQLLSMDDQGKLVTWVLMDVTRNRNDQHYQDDLTLPIGSTVMLELVDTLDLESGSPVNKGTYSFFALCPSDPFAFLAVCSSSGDILHRARSGLKRTPWIFAFGRDSIDAGCFRRPKMIRFHPSIPELFLATYSDGDLALFHLKHVQPLRRWTLMDHREMPMHITDCQWSSHRAPVFFLLNDHGTLYLWDLLVSEREPAKQWEMAPNDNPMIKGHIVVPSSDAAPWVVLSLSSPEETLMEVHVLEEEWIESQTDERQHFLHAMLDN